MNKNNKKSDEIKEEKIKKTFLYLKIYGGLLSIFLLLISLFYDFGSKFVWYIINNKK